MKCWIVPSSLFVPGRLMSPVRILREIETAKNRKRKLEAELAALPAKIEALEQELVSLGEEYKPFETMERNSDVTR